MVGLINSPDNIRLTVLGQMTRIGPNMLLTDDTEFIRKINSVRSNYGKAPWYHAFKLDGNNHNILSEINNERHLEMRNRLVGGYAGTNNPTFESDIDSIIRTVIDQINAKYLSHGDTIRPFDFSQMMMYMTLDVTTLLAMGKAIGYVAADEDLYEYVGTMWKNFPVMNFLSSYPPIVSFLTIPFIQRNTAPSVKESTGLGKIKAIAFEAARERVALRATGKSAEKQDMMESFIKNGLNEAQLADNLLVALLAGSETTATILKAFFVYVIGNHRIYNKLQATCDEMIEEVPLDQIISYNRALHIPYLDACIKEILRYIPAGLGPLPRTVPKGGDWYDGKFLPEGTVIASARWNMSRKNKVYGADFDVFRPERWLEATGEKLAQMERCNEGLFMTGKHRCLGERAAKMEIYKVTFELTRRYDVSSLTPLQPIKESYNYGLWMQRGQFLKMEEREQTSK